MFNFVDSYWYLRQKRALLFNADIDRMDRELKQQGLFVAASLNFTEREIKKSRWSKLMFFFIYVSIFLGLILTFVLLTEPTANIPIIVTTALAVCCTVPGAVIAQYYHQFNSRTKAAIFSRSVCHAYFSRYNRILLTGARREFRDTADYKFVPHLWDMYLQLRSIGVNVIANPRVSYDHLLKMEKLASRNTVLFAILIVVSIIILVMSIIINTAGIWMFLFALILLSIIHIIQKRIRLFRLHITCGFTFKQFENTVYSQYRNRYGYLVGHAEEIPDIDSSDD